MKSQRSRVESKAAELEQLYTTVSGRKIRACGGFAAVPAKTLHVTLADLLAGPSFSELAPEKQRLATRRAVELIDEWRPPAPSQADIIGVGAFSGIAIAIARLPQEWYEAIVQLRRRLYGDRLLRTCGVLRGNSLLTHITLGYVESGWKTAAVCLRRIQDSIREGAPLGAIQVGGASVFEFPHMSRFDPIDFSRPQDPVP